MANRQYAVPGVIPVYVNETLARQEMTPAATYINDTTTGGGGGGTAVVFVVVMS